MQKWPLEAPHCLSDPLHHPPTHPPVPMSGFRRARSHPQVQLHQPSDTAWGSLPWLPWKLGAKNHFQGPVNHSDTAPLQTQVHPQKRPQPRKRRKLVLQARGREEERRWDSERKALLSTPFLGGIWVLIAPLGALTHPLFGFELCRSEPWRLHVGSADCIWRFPLSKPSPQIGSPA